MCWMLSEYDLMKPSQQSYCGPHFQVALKGLTEKLTFHPSAHSGLPAPEPVWSAPVLTSDST